jgi:hypothetical protein
MGAGRFHPEDVSEYGEIRFCFKKRKEKKRKEKKYEHRYFYITDVLPSTYAHRYRLTDREKPDISSNKGGSIGNVNVEIKLDIIERIVWDNLNNKIEDVLNMSNDLFSKHGIDKELSFEELRGMLHRFWKNGYLSFSDK